MRCQKGESRRGYKKNETERKKRCKKKIYERGKNERKYTS